MCLSVKVGTRPETASKPITVYKRLRIKGGWPRGAKCLLSPYREHPYRFGELMVVNQREWEHSLSMALDGFGVAYGFHAYSTLKRARHVAQVYVPQWVFKAIIPAGAQFLRSAFDPEVVSNQMILARPMTWEELGGSPNVISSDNYLAG